MCRSAGLNDENSLTLVGGVDFGEAVVLEEAGIPECGSLCRGCLSDYFSFKAQYERDAWPRSADARFALQSGSALSATLVWVVVGCVCGGLLLLWCVVVLLVHLRCRSCHGTARRWRCYACTEHIIVGLLRAAVACCSPNAAQPSFTSVDMLKEMPSAAVPMPVGGLPLGWSTAIDPDSGHRYFIDPNGQPQWTEPNL